MAVSAQQEAEIRALLAKGNALGQQAAKVTGVAWGTPYIAPSSSAPLGSQAYTQQLASAAQSLGVPNVPQSLMSYQPAQPAPSLSNPSSAGAYSSLLTPNQPVISPTAPVDQQQVPPTPQQNTPTVPQPQNNANTPPIPTNTTYTPPAIPTLDQLMGGSSSQATDNELLQKILGFMTPSAEENALTKEITDLGASTRASYRGIEDQPIALPFVTGQSAAVEKVAQDRLANLQNRAAVLQAQRQTSLDASKFALEYSDSRNDEEYARKVQKATLELQRLGMSADEAYRQATLAMQKYEIDKPSSSSGGGLTEVSPGATLYNPQTNSAVYTAPTAQQTLIQSLTGGSPTSVGGGQAASGPRYSGSVPSVDLGPGSTGAAVQQLQQFLVANGFMSQADMNTGPGTYGPKTKAAVIALQNALGVDNSSGPGYFGARTRAAISGGGSVGGGPSGSDDWVYIP